MKEISIVITMDCEPTKATSHPAATGPVDWELGERAVEGYAAIARSYGFPITYFVHPETAIAQADVFRGLEARGACLGLHMHPWKYSLWKHQGTRYLAHYGNLTENEQRELLAESSDLWRDAIGYRPRYFRPGTFSANDSIFKVLSELGFRGGSCSAPGRLMPEMGAVWASTEADPHRGNASFRHVKGTLDFANMPLSADFSRLLEGRIGRRMHPDFRPDTDWLTQYGVTAESIATNIVSQVVERASAVPVINFISHNQYDYQDDADAACQRYRRLLDALCAACEKAGVRPVGATLAEIVDRVLSTPPVIDPLVCEGAVFDAVGEVSSLPETAATLSAIADKV